MSTPLGVYDGHGQAPVPRSRQSGGLLSTVLSLPARVADFITDTIQGSYYELGAFMRVVSIVGINSAGLMIMLDVDVSRRFLLFCLVLLVSIANVYVLFNQRRTYQLFHSSPQDFDDKPNVKVISMPNRVAGAQQNWQNERDVVTLLTWNPQPFNLAILQWGSPVHVIMWLCAADAATVGKVFFGVALAFTTWLLVKIINQYEGLIEDNRFVSADAYEANNQWAMSKIAVLKKDAATQTLPVGGRRGATPQRPAYFSPPASHLQEPTYDSSQFDSPYTQPPSQVSQPRRSSPAPGTPGGFGSAYTSMTGYNNAYSAQPRTPTQRFSSPLQDQYISPTPGPSSTQYGYMSSPGVDGEHMDVDPSNDSFERPTRQTVRHAPTFLFSDQEPNGHYDASSPNRGGFGFDDAPPTTSLHSLSL